MESEYLEILNDWQKTVANPVIYEHLDSLLPAFQFRRVSPGTSRDHWASRFKRNLTYPRHKVAEKTVIYASDMHIREQGEFADGEWVMTRLAKEMGLANSYEAYRALSERYSLNMPKPDSQQVQSQVTKNARIREVLDALQEYFVWNMKANTKSAKATKVRSYLKRQRKFTAAAVAQLGFGFVPSWDTVEKYITQNKSFTKEELDSACGVRNIEGKTMIGQTHVLSIPYICAGVLKGFIFRRVDSDMHPKYMACRNLDRASVFFNIAEKTDDIVVVEGELDALSATAAGIPSVVAMGGSHISGDRKKQIEDAFNRGVTRIYLSPDLDTMADADTGEEVPNYAKRHEAVMRSVHTIKDVNFEFDNIFVVRFPSPADPDSFIRENGVEAFLRLLQSAVPYWKYDAEYHEDMLSKNK